MTNSPVKKLSRFRPAFMSLDGQGRLVANSDVVFASNGIQAEIEAAKVLARALAATRSTKRSSKRNDDPSAD